MVWIRSSVTCATYLPTSTIPHRWQPIQPFRHWERYDPNFHTGTPTERWGTPHETWRLSSLSFMPRAPLLGPSGVATRTSARRHVVFFIIIFYFHLPLPLSGLLSRAKYTWRGVYKQNQHWTQTSNKAWMSSVGPDNAPWTSEGGSKSSLLGL